MANSAGPRSTGTRTRFWLITAAVVVLVIAIAAAIAGHYASPIAKAEFLKLLREHYEADVDLKSLSISFFPYVHVEGDGLTFRDKGNTTDPPFVSIRHFSGNAGYFGLIGTPKRIRSIRFEGLQINVTHGNKPEGQNQGSSEQSKPAPFLIHTINADGALLQIFPNEAGKGPQQYAIRQLHLYSVGMYRPLHYDAELMNAKPPGVIHATGNFGPWHIGDAGLTPVTGDYHFDNADLSVFKGIAGTLSSVGNFHGELQSIEVQGSTDVPNFSLDVSGHTVHLKTQFSATVDGTSGNTWLHPVKAQFGHTDILCQGGIVGQKGIPGKTVSLDASVKKGRIEDVLYLATKSKTPMRGDLSFQSKVIIPPGHEDVIQKLYLKGAFGIPAAKFTSLDVQQKIQELSNRAQGHPELGHEGSVTTAMKGNFVLKGGSITLAGLAFSVPGAYIALDGSYGLRSQELDFKGTARLDAKVSQTVTGWKSKVLRLADPFFTKNGVGTQIPIKITGTREHPEFGLAFGR